MVNFDMNKIAVGSDISEAEAVIVSDPVMVENIESTVNSVETSLSPDQVLPEAGNDNFPEDGGDPEGGVASVPPSSTDIEVLDEAQKNAERSLASDKKFLPKEEFDLKYKEAFAVALDFLNYQLSLAPKLAAIDTSNKGCRTDLIDSSQRGLTKKEILLKVYGLKENTAWEIEKLTPELVKKTVAAALNEQRLPTRSLAIKIYLKGKNTEEAEAQEEEKAALKKEKFQQKMATDHEKYVAQTSQTPRVLDGELFDVIWADPDKTKMSINDIFGLQIPAAENAILFWWVQPGHLFEVVDTIKHWGFQYGGEAIWNMDDQVVYSGSCFNQTHRMLLVATRGENPPLADREARKKKSVYTMRPDFDIVEKASYYQESIERMFPKGAFLDLFDTDSINPKWTPFMRDENKEANYGTDNN